MNCAEFLRMLDAYLDDELEQPLRGEGEVHLAGCPDCCAEMTDWQTCLEWLRRSMPETAPPAEMWEEVCARIDEI